MKDTKHISHKLRGRILSAAAAVLFAAGLTGCHETEPLPVTEQVPVSVAAMGSHRTKGYVEGTTMADTPWDRLHDGMADGEKEPRTIRLTAWLQPQSGAEQEYFRNELFEKNANGETDGLWHHAPALYWPFGGRLDFLAYSSMIPFGDADITWHGGKSTDALELAVDRSYTQDDILFSFVRDRVAGNSDGHVPMVFDHAQAWIEFRVRSNVADVVTLRDIVLEDIYTDGLLVIDHPFATAEASWNFRLSRREDISVDDSWRVKGGYLGTQTQYLDMLIPEQAQKSIFVKYSFKGSPIILEHRYPLVEGATWLMGKKYIYDITITPTEIKIAPSTVDWDSDVVDIPDDAVYITGDAVDNIGDGFTFTRQSRYYWRADASQDYARVPASAIDGTWGATVSFPEGEDVVTLSFDGSVYSVSITSADLMRNYMKMTFASSGEVSFTGANALEYSLDGGAWTAYSGPVAVASGGVLRWRGDNASYDGQTFASTAVYSASGNLLSIIDADGFEDVTAVGDYAFRSLFRGSTTLTDASSLTVPAATIGAGAMQTMFYGCTGLQHGPSELPAVTLGADAYRGMFYNCSAMADAPAVAATEIPSGAMRSMFYGCAALTAAPEVHIASVADYSLYEMFRNCSSLTDAAAFHLDTDTAAPYSYRYLFSGCSSLVKAPEIYVNGEAPKMCCANMFYQCTSLVDASSVHLNAETVGESAYQSMFNRCSALEVGPYMGAMHMSYRSCYLMFIYCAHLTVAPAFRVVEAAEGCCQQMFENATGVEDVSGVRLPSVAKDAYRSMFHNVPLITKAPDLPVKALGEAVGCYANMFSECSALSEVRMLAEDEAIGNYTGNWLNAVSATGTFHKSAAALWEDVSKNGVPEGWTVIYE